jgi:hypothetical protein
MSDDDIQYLGDFVITSPRLRSTEESKEDQGPSTTVGVVPEIPLTTNVSTEESSIAIGFGAIDSTDQDDDLDDNLNNDPDDRTATTMSKTFLLNGTPIKMRATQKEATIMNKVLYKKEKRQNLSEDELGKLIERATKPMVRKFETKYMSNIDDKNLDTTYSLEALIDRMRQRHTNYDMHDVFQIVLIDEDDQDGRTVVGYSDLYTDYASVTKEQVAASNKWYQTWVEDDTFAENLQLTELFFLNNVDDELFEKVSEEYKTYAIEEQGGPLFFILMMDHMLSNTKEAAEALCLRVENFNLTTIPGEDVEKAVSLLKSACTRLKHFNRLPKNIIPMLLKAMETSSVPEFNEQIAHLKRSQSIASTFKRKGVAMDLTTDDVLNFAAGRYRLLVETGEWTGVSSASSVFMMKETKKKTTTTTTQSTCWNCGSGDHKLPECQKTRNEANIQKNKDKFGRNKKGKGGDKPKANKDKTKPKKKNQWAKPGQGDPTRKKIYEDYYNYNAATKRWEKEGVAQANVADEQQTEPAANVKEANNAMKFYNAMKAMREMDFDD